MEPDDLINALHDWSVAFIEYANAKNRFEFDIFLNSERDFRKMMRHEHPSVVIMSRSTYYGIIRRYLSNYAYDMQLCESGVNHRQLEYLQCIGAPVIIHDQMDDYAILLVRKENDSTVVKIKSFAANPGM